MNEQIEPVRMTTTTSISNLAFFMDETQTILLVDDSENDRLFMRVAFKKANFNWPIQELHDGDEAIAYLKGDGHYSDRSKFPLPAVLLLDLNIPKKNGFDVLKWA